MDTNQQTFKQADLLLKHLRGETSAQEEALVQQWLKEDKRNGFLLESLNNEHALLPEMEFFSTVNVSKAWGKVAQQTINPVNKYINLWRGGLWRYAAILVIACATGIAVFNWQAKEKPQSFTKANIKRYKNDVLPGSNKAILELANGSVVVLDNEHNGELKKERGTTIIKQNGELVYKSQKDLSTATISYNKITTPDGGQYQVVLPDGSKVWLNAGSSLRFPTAFVGTERNVELSGEAYFEVSKNKKMPFKVLANGLNVEVLGTHFNVMAYTNEKTINTTLLEGAVKVSRGADSRLLAPGQQAVVGAGIRLKEVDVEDIVAWKNGFFQFNNDDIQTIMRQIERWYNVRVSYKGKITDQHFTGTISRNTNVSNVLKMLELTGFVRFEIEGKEVNASQ